MAGAIIDDVLGGGGDPAGGRRLQTELHDGDDQKQRHQRRDRAVGRRAQRSRGHDLEAVRDMFIARIAIAIPPLPWIMARIREGRPASSVVTKRA